MPQVVRQGDVCSGHGCFPPRPPAQWSPDVYVNNKNVVRKGDMLQSHCCVICHVGNYAGGRNVYANNQSMQVVGDPITCGSMCAAHSPDVWVN